MTGPRPRDTLPGAEPHVAKNIYEAVLMWGPDVDFTPDAQTWYEATDAAPGSDEKIAVIKRRAELGLPLWHDQDRTDFNGWKKPLPAKLLPNENY
jgi:hypothetical protein